MYDKLTRQSTDLFFFFFGWSVIGWKSPDTTYSTRSESAVENGLQETFTEIYGIYWNFSRHFQSSFVLNLLLRFGKKKRKGDYWSYEFMVLRLLYYNCFYKKIIFALESLGC